MNKAQGSTQRTFKALLLCAAGLLIYANSFKVPFQFDDSVVIVENESIHRLADVPATVQAILHFQPSRLVTLLTFAVNYYIHRLDVFGYHCVNLAIHLLAVFAVWWLGELLLRLSAPQAKKKKAPAPARGEWRQHVPFAAALLFLAHPVNTQAVTYIAQRAESLAAFFYVLTVCLFIKGRLADKKRGPAFLTGAAVAGVLAMFSKETAISLPVTVLFIEFFFFRNVKTARSAAPWKLILGILLGLMIVPAVFHFDIAGIVLRPHESQSHLGDVLTWPIYLLTQLRVFVTFLRLLFVPVGLNLDHDFTMSRSLFEPATFLSFILLAAILWAAWRERGRHPMLAFAAFWFFLALSSNLIPRSHVIFEHKLYLAAAGFLPAFCLGLYEITKNRRALAIVLGVVFVLFAYLTVERNKVWASPITLWEDVARKSPNKGRVHLSLGAAYAAAQQYDKGLAHLNRATTMMSDPYVYTTRGAAYVLKKDDEHALMDFNHAISLDPAFVDAYINRGELYARRKEYRLAALDFNTAIELRPTKAVGYKMRGRLNEKFGRYDSALSDYNRAIGLDPADAQTVAWRGYIYALTGKKDAALQDFEEALRLDPQFSDGYVFRGMHRKESGRPQDALADFNKAVALKPTALAYYQRAVLWLETKRFDEAMKDVNRALDLDEGYDLAYGLRARLYVEKKQMRPAIDDLDRSLQINPDYTDGYLNRSLLHQKMGDLQEAIDDLDKAIALNSKATSAYIRRARIHASLKKFDLALKDLSTAMSLDPRSGALVYNRSVVYKEQGDLTKALADALEAQKLGFPVAEDYLKELQAPR
jgi:protein O-mannosyl-transferase